MNELLAHLTEIQTKTEAWVAEDPQNRWATIPVVDLEHWSKIGITTVAQYNHYNLVCETFELTRSAFGYKPSWTHLDSMSDEDLNKEIDFLAGECKRRMEFEQAEELAHEKAIVESTTIHSGWSIGELTGMDLIDRGNHYEMVLG